MASRDGTLEPVKWSISLFAVACLVATFGCHKSTSDTPEATDPAGSGSTEILHADPVEAAQYLSEDDQIIILDVRTSREYARGRLKGAMNIDFNGSDFRERLSELDPKATYLIHCAVGGRSSSALKVCRELGFEKVIHLDGGYKSWVRAGQPIED